MAGNKKNKNKNKARAMAPMTAPDPAMAPAPAPGFAPSNFMFGASSGAPESSQEFTFAAPANAPVLPALFNLPPVSANFWGILDFGGNTWKEKYLELEDRWMEREDNFGNEIRGLQGSVMTAEAERDTIKDDHDVTTGELQTANKIIADLQAKIKELTTPEEVKAPEDPEEGEPEAEAEDCLFGDESMETDASNETEESYSCQDGATQTIENLEEAATKRKMAEEIAELEDQLKEVRKLYEKALNDIENNNEYIGRIEKATADFEKQYEDEKLASADLKTQLNAEKDQVKKCEEHITDLESRMEKMVEESEEKEEDLNKELLLNADLKRRLERSDEELKWYKNENHARSKESSNVLKEEQRVLKGYEKQQGVIAELNNEIEGSAHFAPDLFLHQKILEGTLAQINKSIEEGPKFNVHPEAYVVPEIIAPATQSATQTLSEDLAGQSGLDSSGGESSSHDSHLSDASDHTTEPLTDEGDESDNNTIEVEKQITLEERLSQAQVLKIEVKVPVEEIIPIPAAPAPVPAPADPPSQYTDAGTGTDPLPRNIDAGTDTTRPQYVDAGTGTPRPRQIDAGTGTPNPQYADSGARPGPGELTTPAGPLPEYTDTAAGPGPGEPTVPTSPQPPPYVQPTVPTPPATPKEKTVYLDRTVEVDRFVLMAPTEHSWLHIERDFFVLLAVLYSTITGTFFPWFIQQVRGTAPINANPVRVPQPEDKESEDEESLNLDSMPQAQMMAAIQTPSPGASAPTNGVAPGSDHSDAPVGTSATETVDLGNLFAPLPENPDTRERIPAAPLTAPPNQPSESSDNGDGNGGPPFLPGPPNVNNGGAHPPGPPNGDGNGGPSGPPTPPNSDGNGGGSGAPPPGPPAPVKGPGFWDIFANRPLPNIFWTLFFMSLHCLVYYFVYLSFSTYFERNLWLGANNATREYLNNIMGVRYTNGILRKIFSDSWAGKIDRSVFLTVTKLGIMELKTFPMPG
ncbi:hypothetical protein BKA65DRAFT_517905 [Rhexocercosporidium sp. MPI-PUGE-AT-0058]|nr:hypothetical protein BKA65DRAFT_517905 [Rhexocercosporidium sp. MPI-PUGE-AT-0058]